MEKNEHIGKAFFLQGTNGVGVLLLHGWTSPPDELLPLAKYLNSSGYSVSGPLLLGHGSRPEDLQHVKWKDWLSQGRQELEKLKRHSEKVFIGGISMGGDLALLLSRDESVAGVITMGAAVKYRLHYLAKLALFFMGLTKKYRRKYYPPWVRKEMGDRKVYMYYPIESAKEVVRLSEATRKFLPRVIKPILIMQSTSDHMVSKESPQIIFDDTESKKKEIFWIKNAYHVFAQKKEVWEKIGDFIQEILSAKS
ncbi:MAG: alpha/beta fold hydrolase [Parcubacteria group bacterium]|jgi:carboxylesterase